MRNPFITKALGPKHPFCNREKELEDLLMHARNGKNVILFGPRRYGKTSLVRRVQHRLREKDSRIEAIMREHIQHHHAGFIFLGSRRRLLRDIFANKGRPFYQSGIMHELAPFPKQELGSFVTEQFTHGGKKCSMDIGLSIADRVECYPYYAQALAYWSFALSDPVCTPDIVDSAFSNLMGSERYGFEAILQALTSAQTSLLRALALQPVMQPTSREFLQTFGLSAGGVQKSLAHLDNQDLIERPDIKGPWKVTDPVFRLWIRETFG